MSAPGRVASYCWLNGICEEKRDDNEQKVPNNLVKLQSSYILSILTNIPLKLVINLDESMLLILPVS